MPWLCTPLPSYISTDEFYLITIAKEKHAKICPKATWIKKYMKYLPSPVPCWETQDKELTFQEKLF